MGCNFEHACGFPCGRETPPSIQTNNRSAYQPEQCYGRCELIDGPCCRLWQRGRNLGLHLHHGAPQKCHVRGMLPFVPIPPPLSFDKGPVLTSALSSRLLCRCGSSTIFRTASTRSSYPAKQPRVPGQQPADSGSGDAPTYRTEAQMRADAAQTAAGVRSVLCAVFCSRQFQTRCMLQYELARDHRDYRDYFSPLNPSCSCCRPVLVLH